MSRLRKISDAINLIKQYKEVINLPITKINGGILEIGCGKGQWLTKMAITNPKKQFYGLEKNTTIILKLLRKLHRQNVGINNLHIINDDAKNLSNWFNFIDEIYLHFPDPWPKDRHAKRRLINAQFLQSYANLLKPKGELIFKTDQKKLFDYALMEISKNDKFYIRKQIENLYENKSNSDSALMTEYESKFVSLNKPIFEIVLQKK